MTELRRTIEALRQQSIDAGLTAACFQSTSAAAAGGKQKHQMSLSHTQQQLMQQAQQLLLHKTQQLKQLETLEQKRKHRINNSQQTSKDVPEPISLLPLNQTTSFTQGDSKLRQNSTQHNRQSLPPQHLLQEHLHNNNLTDNYHNDNNNVLVTFAHPEYSSSKPPPHPYTPSVCASTTQSANASSSSSPLSPHLSPRHILHTHPSSPPMSPFHCNHILPKSSKSTNGNPPTSNYIINYHTSNLNNPHCEGLIKPSSPYHSPLSTGSDTHRRHTITCSAPMSPQISSSKPHQSSIIPSSYSDPPCDPLADAIPNAPPDKSAGSNAPPGIPSVPVALHTSPVSIGTAKLMTCRNGEPVLHKLALRFRYQFFFYLQDFLISHVISRILNTILLFGIIFGGV